jgi:uncharacterized membrane-anchored protein YjiN (DUF445 family)
MTESHPPVGELGDALARISRALSECCKLVDDVRGSRLDEVSRVHLQRTRETFERDVSICIESLQFHDRMIQQLVHAKKCLVEGEDADSTLPEAKRSVEAWKTRHAAEGTIELF